MFFEAKDFDCMWTGTVKSYFSLSFAIQLKLTSFRQRIGSENFRQSEIAPKIRRLSSWGISIYENPLPNLKTHTAQN